MILSLNPTYFCNFRNGKCAETCYLTKDQLASSQLLSIDKIKQRVEELTVSFELEHIDLYGGEITILPIDYQIELMTFLSSLDVSVNLVTNLSNPDSPFITHLPRNFTLSISWDYQARQAADKIFERMKKLESGFSILSLGSHEYSSFDPEMILKMLMELPKLKSFEIKPYNQNQSNEQSYTHKDFENLIQKYILKYHELRPHYRLVNIDLLDLCLSKSKSSWSDQHLYLTPNNELSVLEFDSQGREYFKKVDSIKDYLTWAQTEKNLYSTDPHCQQCPYLGHCLSEHLKPIDHFETNGCSGLKNLIDWYAASLPVP